MALAKDLGSAVAHEDRLIIREDGDFVAIHHGHLDNLVGSVMAVLDMNGDTVQRDAQKSEIKMRIRDWLNEQYRLCGYEEYKSKEGLSSSTK